MAQLAPLKDTQRTVDWDELPPRARMIPDGFDPLAEGVLMRHQAEWIKLKAPIKVCPKGRRTGITFATALDDAITIGSRKSAGGDNIYYIGDTKEKGLEFIGYIAKFLRVIAEAQRQGVSDIEEFLFSDQDDKGNTKFITSYRIRTAAGFQAVALSSRPANIRGLQGKVRIDEAAFHPDVEGVLEATIALLIWGGEISIISSHNGKSNPFNQLIKDIEAGLYGEDAKVLTVTFDQAVENGLYERVCMMTGETPTVEGKKRWYMRIRNAYGPRKAAMREELDAIPRDSGGICIPGIWIERAMTEERPVLRLALDDDFVKKSNLEREKWCEAWIERNLKPLLDQLSPADEHAFGQDYARHRDFTEIAPVAIKQNLRRHVPFVVELHNVPTRQQEQILWYLVDRLPNFRGGAMDATGPGQTLAEYTADRYRVGSGDDAVELIHQIVINRKWYGLWMPKMVGGFEDGIYDLPRDRNLENDLRAVESYDGIMMVPDVRRQDLKDPDLYRHGDFAIALVMGEYAVLNKVVHAPIEYTAAPGLRIGYGSGMRNYMRT